MSVKNLGGRKGKKKKVGDILVVVLFLLFSPVLVELVDFHSSVSLLKQVKCLHATTENGSLGNKTQFFTTHLK